MKDISILISPEHAGKSKEALSTIFDKEIDDFSIYMTTLGDWKTVGPLSPPERALIKTYLIQKTTGKIDGGR